MTVGVYKVKTHLASLLERVEKGEEVTVTRHGVPIAKIVPIDRNKSRESIHDAVARIRELRKGNRLNGLRIRDLIEEGRA